MNDKKNEITEQAHWDGFHQARPKLRLPSRLVITTRNIQDLLKKNVKHADKVLEIGFAPGKQLAYVGSVYGANVTGLDYSDYGVETAKQLFEALSLEANILCESIFESSLQDGTFDIVYSIGVVEHFNDPTEIIHKHIQLLRKGGKAIIAVPNYGGTYGKIQNWFDPENIAIHNLDMMNEKSFSDFANGLDTQHVCAYKFGRFDPSIISWRAKFPSIIAKAIGYLGTALGHISPPRLGGASPWLILEVTK